MFVYICSPYWWNPSSLGRQEWRRNIPTNHISHPVAENKESQWQKTEFQLSYMIFIIYIFFFSPQDLPTATALCSFSEQALHCLLRVLISWQWILNTGFTERRGVSNSLDSLPGANSKSKISLFSLQGSSNQRTMPFCHLRPRLSRELHISFQCPWSQTRSFSLKHELQLACNPDSDLNTLFFNHL